MKQLKLVSVNIAICSITQLAEKISRSYLRSWGNMVYLAVEDIQVYLPILFLTNSFRPQLLIEQCYNRAHENSSSQYV